LEPIDIAYIMLAILGTSYLLVSQRRWRKMKEVAVAELKENFFPQLIDNLKALDKRLSEEEIGGEGYVELLGTEWKSTLILNFHRYYRSEEEAFSNLKQELERYEEDVKKWKKSEDERLKEKTLRRKMHIRKDLTKLIKRPENLM